MLDALKLLVGAHRDVQQPSILICECIHSNLVAELNDWPCLVGILWAIATQRSSKHTDPDKLVASHLNDEAYASRDQSSC